MWNFTRKLVTGNLNKQFKTFDVNNTIDNFCRDKVVEFIDVLKIDTEGSEAEVLEELKICLIKQILS